MKGHVTEQGKGNWYAVFDVRDPVTGKRKRKWRSLPGCKGKREAQERCAKLIADLKSGGYVESTKLTVGQWIDQWLDAGAPGRRRKKVSQRTLERYGQLLRTHVKPAFGERPLQKLQATEIDKFYLGIDAKGEIAPRTAHHLHIVFGACLATAHRKGMIAANPMARVEQVPNAEEQILDEEDETNDIGRGLDEAELARLIAGFEPTSLYPVVVTAATTGARRNELLALRWTDLDPEKKTLRIERAWETTKKYGLRLKPPKTKRGLRTIELDDATVALLLKEKERHQRIMAGIPDGVDVDLSLIKLPATALIFPAVPEGGEDFDFCKPRNPPNFTIQFSRRVDHLREQARKAGLPSFGKTRFHDLRGIHATALLDAGKPVHTVAQRIGDDPAVLLRSYAKRQRSKKANESFAATLAAFTAGFLGPSSGG
jgi:integrase